jgi:hypothetical protein
VAFGALDPIGVAQFTAPKLLASSAVLNNRQRSFAGEVGPPKGTTTTRTLKREEFGAKLRKVPISVACAMSSHRITCWHAIATQCRDVRIPFVAGEGGEHQPHRETAVHSGLCS